MVSIRSSRVDELPDALAGSAREPDAARLPAGPQGLEVEGDGHGLAGRQRLEHVDHASVSGNLNTARGRAPMIRKLSSGKFRLYSRKLDPRTGKRKNLGTFATRAAAERHERAVQFFKRRG
jgi:hypothetical protein